MITTSFGPLEAATYLQKVEVYVEKDRWYSEVTVRKQAISYSVVAQKTTVRPLCFYRLGDKA